MIPLRLRQLKLVIAARCYSVTSDHLVTRWRQLLAGEDVSGGQALKKLLTTALQTRKERVQEVFPDDIVSAFTSHYRSLHESQKREFFLSLAQDFSINHEAVDAAIEDWQKKTTRTSASGLEVSLRAAERLACAARPLYSRLWQPLVQNSTGLEFLVGLRGDLLSCIGQHPAGAAPLRIMSEDLRRLLANWFTVSLLRLERVTWSNSSASMLETIAAEEKVHAIKDWRSLKHRLGRNRRVYVWTHPSLPGQPLVALHIALCQAMASSMDEILGGRRTVSAKSMDKTVDDEDETEHPTTAMFYSISSMKPGLAGVDLGNNLIKRAVRQLLVELPTLKNFATISPMPGFAAWLDLHLSLVQTPMQPPPLLLQDEYDALVAALGNQPTASANHHNTRAEQARLLQCALSESRRSEWLSCTDSKLSIALRGPLIRLGAWYLAKEKHRGRALDPVANFHLRNGACIARINFKADVSAAGLRKSHGLMVNYEYDMGLVEERNRKYVVDGLIDVRPLVEESLTALTQ